MSTATASPRIVPRRAAEVGNALASERPSRLPAGAVARTERAIGNHAFCALRAFLRLEGRRSRGLFASWYELKRHLIDQAVGAFIQQMAGQHS
jgi:hypothetical protein